MLTEQRFERILERLKVKKSITVAEITEDLGISESTAGGIIYTVGGIIYALKVPIFNNKHKNFGSHEIFHLFVMGGSICHFIVMYGYLLP